MWGDVGQALGKVLDRQTSSESKILKFQKLERDCM